MGRPDHLFAVEVDLAHSHYEVRIDKLPVDQELIAREIWEREEKKEI